MDLPRFALLVGLLAAAASFLALTVWYGLAARRAFRAGHDASPVISDLTAEPIRLQRGVSRAQEDLAQLGFERVGVMGIRWPWLRAAVPLRMWRSPDARTTAAVIERPAGEAVVSLESNLADGFVVATTVPEDLRVVGDRSDHLGLMTSVADASEQHSVRLAAAEAIHGAARPFVDIATAIQGQTESDAAGLPRELSLALRPYLRGRLARLALSGVAAGSFALLALFWINEQAEAPPGIAWSRIEPLPASGIVLVNGLIAVDDGFVAVGETVGDGGRLAAAWSSANGATWTQAFLDETTATEDDLGTTIHAATAGSFGLLGVGIATPSTGDLPSSRIWTSDGTGWRPVEAVGLDGYPFYVATDGSTLIAGGQAEPVDPDEPGSIGALWSSPDGRAWRRASIPSIDLVDDVVHGSAGWVVLGVVGVGSDAGGQPLILHSADGVTWNSATVEGLPREGDIEVVVAVEQGYVAVGSDGSEGVDGAVWRSADGLTWRSHDIDSRVLGNPWLHGLASGPAGLVLVGDVGDVILDPIPSAWTSADGRAWRWSGDIDPRHDASPHHVAVGADRAVAFGLGEAGSVGWLGIIADR